MEQEKSEIEALREQVDQLTQLNTDMVAVVQKLTTDLNTLAQLVILARGRYNRGCRVCGQKPVPGDPPLMKAELRFHDNGHYVNELSADTLQMLKGENFS
jgi:tRNA U34 5-carboxymethylaminomethyl modifying enzyme MnmG/GidA